MYPRSGLLAVVFCLIGAAIVVPGLMYGVYRAGISQGEFAARIAPPPPRSPHLTRPVRSGTGPGETITLEPAEDPDEGLQLLIDKKNEQLAGQQEELARQREQIEELEIEIRELSAFVEELIVAETGAASPVVADGADAAPPAPPRTREQLEAELRALGQQLEQARAAQTMLSTELDAVKAQAALDAAAMQLAAEQSIDDERRLREAASEVLVEGGEAVVPILILMLRDDQPAIRGYAAGVLGAMRARAQSAIGALSETAAADPDEQVREAARRALRSIRD